MEVCGYDFVGYRVVVCGVVVYFDVGLYVVVEVVRECCVLWFCIGGWNFWLDFWVFGVLWVIFGVGLVLCVYLVCLVEGGSFVCLVVF